MEDPLSLENRRRIYQSISDSPGTFLREMERSLGMPPGLLSYHLDYMEKRGLIRSEDDGYRKRYFSSETFRQRDRRTISLLRQDSPRRILVHLLVNGDASFSELQDEMSVAKSTLSYHLKRLLGSGIVRSEKREREKFYSVENPEEVADLLISIKHVIGEDSIDRFAEIWEKLSSRE